jgi:hypothetical protein
MTASIAALTALALAISCRGFFVKPTLTSLVVAPPTPSLQFGGTTGNTQQMSAVGTFNDGSTGSANVSWALDSNGANAATITSGGLLTAVALGGGQITATSTQNPSIQASTTFTVTVPCIQSIAVSPTSPSIAVNSTQAFTAQANTCNGPKDVTTVASWASSNPSIATMTNNTATAVAAGSTNITASSGGVTSPADVLTVTP